MALNPPTVRALHNYVARIQSNNGVVHRETIKAGIVLTAIQQQQIAKILTIVWGREYPCPLTLDLKPEHGYKSRVLKDGFTPDQYVEWIVLGCSDAAEVGVDASGRPHLTVHNVLDHRKVEYDVVVPIRSDAHGYVHVDGVIPKGIF